MKDRTTDELARILWDYNKLNQPLEKADCILALGSHDTRVAERAAEIYLQGWAPLIIFSGRYGKITSLTRVHFDKTEAETFADIAQKLGVPEDKILLETKATNTSENIIFTKELIKEKGLSIKKVILVQKPYMKGRSYATLKKQWPQVEVIVTSPQLTFENCPHEHRTKEELIHLLVGDTQRIKFYAEQGFQIPQDIPDEVWQAVEELIKRGYIHHLVQV